MSRTITTISAAATNRNLTQLATVKAVFSITDTTQDTYLTLLIAQASAAAESYCGRVFARETLQDLVLPDRDNYPYQVPGGVRVLQASRWPISTLTSVVEDTTTLVSGTDFQPDLAAGQLFRLGSLTNVPVPWSAVPVTLTYIGGYALPGDSGANLPADIEAGVIEIIKAAWSARLRDPAIRSETIPELISTTYQIAMPSDSGLPPSAEGLLDNYRVPMAGGG